MSGRPGARGPYGRGPAYVVRPMPLLEGAATRHVRCPENGSRK
nr:MAG TPA: hypothetical protein [Caudoviricetes sp.]